MLNKKTLRNRGLLLVAAAVGVSCTFVASAVSLGVSANNALGAGTSVTSSCQPTTGPSIGIAFPDSALSVVNGNYTANGLSLTGIAAACNGKTIKISVLDASNNALATYSGTVSGTTLSASLSGAVIAANVANVAIIING